MKLFSTPPLARLSRPRLTPEQAADAPSPAATGNADKQTGNQGAAQTAPALPPSPQSQTAPRPAVRAHGPIAPAALPEAPAAPRIVAISRLAVGGRWRVEAMRALNEPCLLWFTRGQGRITVGGVTRGYGVHNAVFIPAGVMHGFEVTPQSNGLAVFFGRDSAVALPDRPLHLRIRDVAAPAELSGFIDAAGREIEGARPASGRAAAAYLGLIGVWLERQAAEQAGEGAQHEGARRIAARYAQLLERDFRSGDGVAEYAAALGVTPTHLSRSCRATSGRSALDLLQDRRLYEARRMLSETSAPVKEISASLGFASPAYFARAFHARTGKTPSDFRKDG